MIKKILLFLLMLLFIFLCGCYESSYPLLGDTKQTIDKNILGIWMNVESKLAQRMRLNIQKDKNRKGHYIIRYKNFSTNVEKTFKGTIVSILDYNFANIESEEDKFLLFAYKLINNNKMQFYIFRPLNRRFLSSIDLTKFIKNTIREKKLNEILEPAIIFYKAMPAH